MKWVYGLGAVDNILITHEISSKGAIHYITYLDITNESEIRHFTEENYGENVVAGSNVNAISPEEYYFVSGGNCYN